MKVYFEETGGGCGKVSIKAFVHPTRDGHGYWYTENSKLTRFAWCSKKGSKEYDINELDEDLLFSFKHGVHYFQVDEKFSGYKWKLKDLEYEKKDKEDIIQRRKAFKKLDKCKTIDDIYNIYKDLKKIDSYFAIKALNILNVNTLNESYFMGEIGVSAFENLFLFMGIMQSYKKNNLKTK